MTGVFRLSHFVHHGARLGGEAGHNPGLLPCGHGGQVASLPAAHPQWQGVRVQSVVVRRTLIPIHVHGTAVDRHRALPHLGNQGHHIPGRWPYPRQHSRHAGLADIGGNRSTRLPGTDHQSGEVRADHVPDHLLPRVRLGHEEPDLCSPTREIGQSPVLDEERPKLQLGLTRLAVRYTMARYLFWTTIAKSQTTRRWAKSDMNYWTSLTPDQCNLPFLLMDVKQMIRIATDASDNGLGLRGWSLVPVPT